MEHVPCTGLCGEEKNVWKLSTEAKTVYRGLSTAPGPWARDTSSLLSEEGASGMAKGGFMEEVAWPCWWGRTLSRNAEGLVVLAENWAVCTVSHG